VGWLIVEDIAMVFTLVLLPALAPALKEGATLSLWALAFPIAVTLGKVAAFVAIMLIVGRRLIPWILHYVAHTGSRELFRLCVLAIALGVAFGAAILFDVSFALGAFFAGMILSESELSQRAASETLPLRDAFAVLFFVSVGMLFDPTILVREPLAVLGVLGIVIIGKSLAALAITTVFKLDRATSLTVAASLAQIGEFSFILAATSVSLGAMSRETHDLILASALLSISLNPFVFALIDRMGGRVQPPAKKQEPKAALADVM
jgi:CPA2 family monovalent cation:H+ antiporter-2